MTGLNFAAKRISFVSLIALIGLISACGFRGGYYKDDGPPKKSKLDVKAIPDAIPRKEALSASGNRPYKALGKKYVPLKTARGYREKGIASWYGKKFHGRRTSSGEIYDMYKMTAAHPTLPLPSYVRVKNLNTGKTVVVRVNDRGPFLHNRIIDLSYAAAYKLGIVATGTGRVEVSAVFANDGSTLAGKGSSDSNFVKEAGSPVKDLSFTLNRIFIQFGAFVKRKHARSMVQSLQQNGIRFAHIEHSDDGYYRVLSGPFSSSQSAEEILQRGRQLGLNANVVSE